MLPVLYVHVRWVMWMYQCPHLFTDCIWYISGSVCKFRHSLLHWTWISLQDDLIPNALCFTYRTQTGKCYHLVAMLKIPQWQKYILSLHFLETFTMDIIKDIHILMWACVHCAWMWSLSSSPSFFKGGALDSSSVSVMLTAARPATVIAVVRNTHSHFLLSYWL